MSDNSKTFIWAHDVNANVKEPIQALKEQGWRYGDVPAASNFNWIFKTMTEEIVALRKELAKQRENFEKAMAQQADKNDKLFNRIGRTRDDLEKLEEVQKSHTKQLTLALESTWDLLRLTNSATPWPTAVFSQRFERLNTGSLIS